MTGFFITKRRFVELIALLLLDGVFYLLWQSFDFVILFSLGFIWNWVAVQEKEISFDNTRRYRFSTIKTVFNLQNLFLKPFSKMPETFKLIIKCLPAGIFWSAVILFNESLMPWWAVFLGSLCFELVVLEKKFFAPKEAIK